MESQVMLGHTLLERMATFTLRAVIARHPEIFDRLGPYAKCRYLIDPTDLPITFLLLPHEKRVSVQSRRRTATDATIRGHLMTLVTLAQGNTDGDALFFNRDISIEGNTEALLALRNALDDADVDIIRDSLEAMGFVAAPLKLAYKAIREIHPIVSGMFAP